MQDDLSPVTRALIAEAKKLIAGNDAFLSEMAKSLDHSRRVTSRILASLGIVDQLLQPESDRRL